MTTTRRDLIRAAGATAGGAAFLARFASSFTGQAQAATAPKRMILFWHANGAPKAGDFSFLEPVSKAGGVQIFRNVTQPGTGDHKTGMPFSTTGTINNPPNSTSIDQLVARAGGKPALVLTGKAKPQNYRGWVSFDGAGATVLPTESPRQAFAAAFGSDPGGGGPPIGNPGGMPAGPPAPPPAPTANYGAAVEDRILATVMADVEQVRARLPMLERPKMDAQLDALKNIASTLGPATTGASPVGATQQRLLLADCTDRAKLATMFREPADGFDYRTRIKLHVELILASFLCDTRRVATLMMTPGGHDSMEYSFVGVPGSDPHNTIAHKIYDDAANVEKMRKIKLFEMDWLATLIKRLKETPDVDGKTLFDNTLVLATTECRDGNHGTGPIPLLVAGGPAANVTGAKYNEILASCARACGASVDRFGSG